MHRMFFIALFWLFSFTTMSQFDSLNTASILRDVQLRQQNISRTGMISLTGWSAVNMIGGGVMMTQTTGQQRYFHQMNLFWNVVNLGIGVPGLLGTYKEKPGDFESVFTLQKRYETVYALNTGLDLGYVATGWALNNYGKTRQDELGTRLKGYGNSLVLQGTYLFVHDLIMFGLYRTNRVRLNVLWKRVSIQPTGLGVILHFH